jgi:hypothetical protein
VLIPELPPHGGPSQARRRTVLPRAHPGPGSYTGLEVIAPTIDLWKSHNLPGLDFVQGDAENLPFFDQ